MEPREQDGTNVTLISHIHVCFLSCVISFIVLPTLSTVFRKYLLSRWRISGEFRDACEDIGSFGRVQGQIPAYYLFALQRDSLDDLNQV